MGHFEFAKADGAAAVAPSPFHAELNQQYDVAKLTPEAQKDAGTPAAQLPAELSPAMKKLSEAVEAFNKKPDKARALKDQTKNFEDSIKLADGAVASAYQAVQPELTKMKPVLELALTDIGVASYELELAFYKLALGPDGKPLPQNQRIDQSKARKLLSRLSGDATTDGPTIKQIEANPKFKPIVDALKVREAAFRKHKSTIEQYEKVMAPVAAAMEESIKTRSTYIDTLKAGNGDPKVLQKTYIELQLLQKGVPPDKFDAILKQRQGGHSI